MSRFLSHSPSLVDFDQKSLYSKEAPDPLKPSCTKSLTQSFPSLHPRHRIQPTFLEVRLPHTQPSPSPLISLYPPRTRSLTSSLQHGRPSRFNAPPFSQQPPPPARASHSAGTLSNPASPSAEYRHKTLTKLFNNNSRAACYALAVTIFSLGLFRDALYLSPPFPPPFTLI